MTTKTLMKKIKFIGACEENPKIKAYFIKLKGASYGAFYGRNKKEAIEKYIDQINRAIEMDKRAMKGGC